MSKTFSNYIATLDYVEKNFFALSAPSGTIPIESLGTVTSAPVGIISASISLVFSVRNVISKMNL